MKRGNINYIEFRTGERIMRISEVLGRRRKSLTVVLENINDPHNLSAVLRTCDAVGIFEVHLLYHGGQPIPKVSPTSSGSAKKWVYRNLYDSVDECYSKIRSENKKIYTTNITKDVVSLYSLDLTVPVALVFGNEHAGVSEEATVKADGNFLIPQVGMIQSLNISVACAVCLFEAYRQRLAAGQYEKPELSETEFESLMIEWSAK